MGLTGRQGGRNDDDGGDMKKQKILVLLVSFSTVALNFHLSNAQQFSPLFLNAKPSQNGLEVSDYRKIAVIVESLAESAKKIGLTKKGIEGECESRLRQARFFAVPTGSRSKFLYIMVHIVGNAYIMEMNFNRIVLFEVEKTRYIHSGATTWRRLATGLHGGDPEYIMQCLHEGLDDFLKAYQKANAK